MDPVQLIKEDHNQLKDLFRAFQSAGEHRIKERIARRAILELEVLVTVEEEVFFPSVRHLEGARELVASAENEHHSADAIALKLSELPRADQQYEEEFTALGQIVEHHIEHEEAEVLPKASFLDEALRRQLGERMEMRKRELMGKSRHPRPARRTRPR